MKNKIKHLNFLVGSQYIPFILFCQCLNNGVI